MTEKLTAKPPVWFWIVSVLALVWNCMGALAYIAQAYMSIEDLEKLSQAERLLYENQPSWVTAAFAIAVWGGTLGCILLLLRKRLAKIVLFISLLGILVQMTESLFISKHYEVHGSTSLIMSIMIIVVGIALVFFSRLANKRHWLS